MKCCKIISTHFNHRKERNRGHWAGVTWPSHIQFGLDPQGVLIMLKDQISIETDVDAGVKCDTIIVNGRAGFKEGDDYVRSINGQKTLCGKIFSIEMDNIGGQFGAYNLAYKIHEGKYDYWMFDEDDIVVTGHHYYKKLINRLGVDEYCYALIGLGRADRHTRRLGKVCPPGAMLLVNKKILEHLKRVDGMLPHPIKSGHKSRVQKGELAFSLRIYDLGYKIVYYGKSKQGKTVEWEYETEYCLPYRELIEKFGTVDYFKQSTFYRGVGWDILWKNANESL